MCRSTKFGRSQVDLRVDEEFETTVIEAKNLKKPLNSSHLATWFSQLRSYMDQAPVRHRGALALFNFSDVPIYLPEGSTGGRYHIVAVNLCAVPPSQRKASMELRFGRTESGEPLVQAIPGPEGVEVSLRTSQPRRRSHGRR